MTSRRDPFFSFIFPFLLFSTLINGKVLNYHLIVKKIPGNPDGFPRPVIGFFNENGSFFGDRPFPGPLLRGKLGDVFNVTIQNELMEEIISIHFHGLRMLNNPWMDGTASITQCPISPHSSFIYQFELKQTGTFWYHSHISAQYGDGLLGPLIIDYPDDTLDPIKQTFQYSSEHIFILQDWFHETNSDLLVRYVGTYGIFPNFRPDYPWPTQGLLLNGRGQFNCSLVENCNTTEQCIISRRPLLGPCNSSIYEPDQYACTGNSVRIRIINGAENIPIKFWIDRHNMTIVVRDGVEVIPMQREWITLTVGQRVDAIISCDRDPNYKYYIYAAIDPAFIPQGSVVPYLYVYGFLTYSSSSNIREPLVFPLDNIAQEFNQTYSIRNRPQILDEYTFRPLNEVPRFPPVAKRIVLYTAGLDYTVNDIGYPTEIWTVNNISFIAPSEPILQNMILGYPINSNPVSGNPSKQTYIEHLQFQQYYEMILVGQGLYQQHPWHLHGYSLSFVGAGFLNLTAIETNQTSPNGDPIYDFTLINWDDYLAPLDQSANVTNIGDSFTVPNGGFTAFRIFADNLGPWFLHCHVGWHMFQGMALVISVETENGDYNGIQSPPQNFPLCGQVNQWKNFLCSPETPQISSPDPQIFKNLLITFIVLFVLSMLIIIFLVIYICKASNYHPIRRRSSNFFILSDL